MALRDSSLGYNQQIEQLFAVTDPKASTSGDSWEELNMERNWKDYTMSDYFWKFICCKVQETKRTQIGKVSLFMDDMIVYINYL